MAHPRDLSISACHKSGWMPSDIFVEWFHHFVKHTNSTAGRPALLILEGHSTHTNSLTLIHLVRTCHVTIICLPPHTTHQLQPLDVSFMKPLNTYIDEVITKWLRIHPGRVVTQFQVAAIFGEVYIKAATVRTAMNGFRRTGIYPTDHHIFEDSDFDASLVTYIPEEHTSSSVGQTLPSLGQTSSALGQASSAVSQTSSAVGQTLRRWARPRQHWGRSRLRFHRPRQRWGRHSRRWATHRQRLHRPR